MGLSASSAMTSLPLRWISRSVLEYLVRSIWQFLFAIHDRRMASARDRSRPSFASYAAREECPLISINCIHRPSQRPGQLALRTLSAKGSTLWQLVRRQRQTSTGISTQLSTLLVSPPSTRRSKPVRPCVPITIRSQPYRRAAPTMAAYGRWSKV